ncbi:MAG: phospholipase C/P1 nuclease family protein [Gammaproteobacteria bacterium]
MKYTSIIFISLYAIIWPTNSTAYEPGTHMNLAEQAAQQSVLRDSKDILYDIGLKSFIDASQQFPLQQAGNTIALGPNNMDLYTAPSVDTILGLIKAGAALEDESSRSLFHFHDPVPGHINPLNILGIPMPYSAPDWALADSLLPPIGQSYSLKKAEHYFYDALTSPDEKDRNQAFGNLFLSIGHAIHLIQDEAQPQHTRNDMHCDADICKEAEAILKGAFGSTVQLYNPSLYESYTYEKANIAGYNNYSPVVFPTARSYWVSQDNKGLAQFTNSNFVSAGTNFRLSSDGSILPGVDYTLPFPSNLSGLESIDEVYAELGKPVPAQIAQFCALLQSSCGIRFVSTDVVDGYTGMVITNDRASSYSIFNQDLEIHGSQKLFTLNVPNFQKAWLYLLPRAVGYSAGLINYFFRGRLDIQPDPDNPGGYLVTNKSRYPMSDGTLELFYDATDSKRYPVPGASWSGVNMAAASNGSTDQYPIQFDAPVSPVPANPGQYMLVFKGKIGAEDGVAGKLLAKPTYLYTTTNRYCSGPNTCSTIWAFTNDFNFSTLHVIGTNSTSGALGIYSLAVYDGIDYTLRGEFDPYQGYSNYGCGDTLTQIHGRIILKFPCWGSTETTTIDGIAVNSNYLYISGLTHPTWTESVYVYDHSGNPIDILQSMPATALTTLAVNDSRMCFSGWDTRGLVATTVLTDLQGDIVSQWPGDPYIGGGPCALAKDRLYILAWGIDHDAVLNIYDMNGLQITSLGLPNSSLSSSTPIGNVFATNTQIYLTVGCVGQNCNGDSIITYNRILTHSADGKITSEEFIRQPDVAVPWYTNPYWSGTVVVDMKDILGDAGT